MPKKLNKPMVAETPKVPQPATVGEQAPPLDWEFWRRRGYCRVWHAALLSLGVEPSNANRKKLKAADKSKFFEYEKRKQILAVNRGLHPLLSPKIEHAMEGKAHTEKYVKLESVLALAIEQKWSAAREFEAGLRTGGGGKSKVHSLMHDEEEDEPADVASKGARYAHQRLGAALQFIEQILNDDRSVNKAKFLNGKTLNHSAVAGAFADILEKPGVHGVDGVRKAIGHALKSLPTTKSTRR